MGEPLLIAVKLVELFSTLRMQLTLTEYEMLAHEQASNFLAAYFKLATRRLDAVESTTQANSAANPNGTSSSEI